MSEKKLKIAYLFIVLVFILSACRGGNLTPTLVSQPSPKKDGDSVPTSTADPVEESDAEVEPIDLTGPDIGTTMKWVDGSLIVFVPASEFTMGHGGEDNPQHVVALGSFWIYRTEVTNRMYANCVSTGNCTSPESEDYLNPKFVDKPVVGVEWAQADAYCTWVKGNLPSEAQWEKTARGTTGSIHPWGDGAPNCDRLNFDNCLGELSNVTNFVSGQSDYEVFDMAGNVFEWNSDWYDADYYQTSPTENPYGPESGEKRSVRGSSFESGTERISVANRFFLDPTEKRYDLGFRCVVIDPIPSAPYCVTSAHTDEIPEPRENNCEPIIVSNPVTFCEGEGGYVSFDVGDTENSSVTVEGGDLDCGEYQDGRLSCGPLTPESIVNVTVCNTECYEGNDGGGGTMPGYDGGDEYCETDYSYNSDTGDCDYEPSSDSNGGDGENATCIDGYGYNAKLGCCARENGGGEPDLGCDIGYSRNTEYGICVPSGDGYDGDGYDGNGYDGDGSDLSCQVIPITVAGCYEDHGGNNNNAEGCTQSDPGTCYNGWDSELCCCLNSDGGCE